MLHRLVDILSYPTVIGNTHESCYRAYQILDLVQELLVKHTPPDQVLDIIQDLHRCDDNELALRLVEWQAKAKKPQGEHR